MRVLWTHNFDPSNSFAGVFMYVFAEGMKRQGVNIEFKYLGNLRHPKGIIQAIKSVNNIGQEYDIVHAQFGSACALATSFMKDVPKMVSLRGSDWNTYDDRINFYYWHTRLAHFMTRKSLNRFDSIVTMSNMMKKSVLKKFPNKICQTLPDPFDLNKFKPANKVELREKLGFPGNSEKWILFNSVDINKPIKRFDLAKSALSIAQKTHGHIRVRVASNIPYSQMPDFVASCDLILCTSTAEGWPNSVKEALACNIPFVSTDVSDLSEIASKETSCRVCPPDPVILADAICEVLSMPPDHRLRKYVEDMNIDNTCTKLLEIYNQILVKK